MNIKIKLSKYDKYLRISLAFPFGLLGLLLISIANLISPEAIKLKLDPGDKK
jgi:hypothetical protein